MGTLGKNHFGAYNHIELHEWVESLDEVVPFFQDTHKSSIVTSYAMLRELGGINDNLALHVHDLESGKLVPRSSLRGAIVKESGLIGLEIESAAVSKIEILIPGFERFSVSTNKGFIIFPERAARALVHENIEPVLVRKWLLHTTFSELDPKTSLYKDEMWELIENDAFLYSQLISRRQMVLQGLHDIVDHAASATSEGWTCASKIARKMYDKLSSYFHPAGEGNIPSHLIPLAAGVILDELAQMPHYRSEGRIFAILLLLQKLDSAAISPSAELALRDFPTSIDEVTAAARNAKCPQDFHLIESSIEKYIGEVCSLTYEFNSNEGCV